MARSTCHLDQAGVWSSGSARWPLFGRIDNLWERYGKAHRSLADRCGTALLEPANE